MLEEIIKFKKSKVKLCLLILLVPSVIQFIMYAFNDKYNHFVQWEPYLNIIITFLNDIAALIVYGIITAYIFGNEYESKTINVLFTYPVSRIRILFSKLLCILTIITISMMFTFILSIMSGLVLEHEKLTSDIFLYYLWSFIKVIIYQFMLVPITAAISIIYKNILTPIIFCIGASFGNLIIVNTHIAAFYPWSAPVLLSPHENAGRTFTPDFMCFVSLIVIFVIGLFISAKKYRYIE